MPDLFRSKLTFANVASLLALFIALSGIAYAATLPKNSVGTKQIKKNAVTSKKLSKKVRAQLRKAGERGPKGEKGDTGATGAAGANGANGADGAQGIEGPPGPGGVVSFAQVNTEESHSSNAITDLATVGPSITVTVPDNGYLMYAARSELSSPVGTDCSAIVTSPTAIATSVGAGFAPGTGAFQTIGNGAVLTPAPGSHTFKLQYQRNNGAAACTYKNRRLWITVVTPPS